MQSPSTGVAVIITHNDKILIGERMTTPQNCWQLPGGLIKLGETPLQAIKREAFEETNLTLLDEEIIALTNNIFCASSHSISLIFIAKCKNPTKLIAKEINKCQGWYWTSWDELPSPLFLPLKTLVDSGFHPFLSISERNIKNKPNNCFIF